MNKYLVLILTVFLFACESIEETSYTNISIARLREMYMGYPLDITDNITISGRVTANNSTPNLRYRIIIEDETAAIEVKTFYEDMQSLAPIGSMVTLRCQGLCLGGYGGLLELGVASSDLEYQTDMIPEEDFARFVEVDKNDIVDVDYFDVEITDLTPTMISRMVSISNLTVVADDYSVAWCDNYDETTNTTAVDENGNEIVLRVSGYFDFALSRIPSAAIDAKGSVGYFNGYQLRLLEYEFSE